MYKMWLSIKLFFIISWKCITKGIVPTSEILTSDITRLNKLVYLNNVLISSKKKYIKLVQESISLCHKLDSEKEIDKRIDIVLQIQTTHEKILDYRDLLKEMEKEVEEETKKLIIA